MVQKADFNPLSEVGLLKDYSKEPIRMHFNPLNEVLFKKEHLHFTIDSLGRQGPFLHTPANPSKNKMLLCKLDGLDEIAKRPNR
jgi:hypothetical protein